MYDTSPRVEWRTTRSLELCADHVLLVESLIPDGKLIRRLTHVGGQLVPDVSILARRYQNTFRIIGQAALLVTSRKMRFTCHHPMRVSSLRVEALCRVLAFADRANEVAGVPAGSQDRWVPGAAKPEQCGIVWAATLPREAMTTPRTVEQWIVLQAVEPSDATRDVLTHLRRQEAYHITRFLLRPESGDVDLKDLAGQYGLSYSQFRMLCKRSLGTAAKAQRNRWRAGRALLGMILDGDSVIDAAVAHGYASASHISTEIKREFGLAPSRFIHAQKSLLSGQAIRTGH